MRKDEFPEKEQTVTQTDWFDPFTITPWANKKKYATDDYNVDNDTEEKGDGAQSNSKAISGCGRSVVASRTVVVLAAISMFLFLWNNLLGTIQISKTAG